MRGFFDDDDKQGNKPFYMKRSIGRDYRKEFEKRLKEAKTIDDLRFIATNFDSALVKLAYLRALAYMEAKAGVIRVRLPMELRTKEGVLLSFGERKEIEVKFDPMETPGLRESFLAQARVEVPRAVHRCSDVSELAFFLGD